MKKLLITILMLMNTSLVFAYPWGSGLNEGDIEIGDYSLDGNGSIYFDPNDDDINEIEMTATGGLNIDGKFSAEHLSSTDDADITDALTAGNIIIDEAKGTLDFTGATSATITSSGSGDIGFGNDNLNDITTLTATNLAGTLSTAAQGNITSLGTLTGLTVSGAIAANGDSITSDGVLVINATSTTSFNDESITNVNDIALDSISSDGSNISIAATASSDILQIGDGTYSWDHAPMVGIEGILEVDSQVFIDNYLHLYNSGTLASFLMYESATQVGGIQLKTDFDQLALLTRSGGGNQFVFTSAAWRVRDHDHATSSYLDLILQDGSDPNISNNKWGKFYHNNNDFVITTGALTGEGSAPATVTNDIVLQPTGLDVKITGAATIDGAADAVQLIVKGHSTQTENLQQWTDDSDNVLANVTTHGKIQSTAGVRGVANDWGDSLSGWAHGSFTAEHTITDDAGNFDATGNANGEKYFYDTTNSPFTQDDETNRNWIVINSGTFQGAKAEIEDYISADGVTLHAHGTCWDEDLSGLDYKIYKAPQVIVSDCYDTHIHVGTEGEIHMENCGGKYTGTNSMVNLYAEFDTDNSDAMKIRTDADGHGGVSSLFLPYETGDIQTGDVNRAMQISINETAATDGEVDGIRIETTDAVAGVEKHGIHIGTGFDAAMIVSGADAEDPDYGYEVTSGSETDRVNSGGGGDDAFINAAVDAEIFDNNGDDILIGSDAQFEVIEVNLETVSSKDVEVAVYYSKTGGGWTALPGYDDATKGFTSSGLIDFAAPADWTADDEDLDGNAITNAYYIAITRTYAPVIPTLPTENYFKTYSEQSGDTGMEIRGNGSIKLSYLTGAPSNLVNGLVWMESDGLHIYYNNAEKTVAGV